MKKLLEYGCVAMAGIFGLCALIFPILSQFVRSIGPDKTIYDGFGRPLEIAPSSVRFLYVNDTMWPGLFWAVFDGIFSFGILVLIYLMLKLSSKFEDKDKTEIQN